MMNAHPTITSVVVHGPDDVRLDTQALRDPADDEAIIKIAYGGICGSDIHYWKHGAVGESILREPMTLGHEVVGVVVRQASNGSGPVKGTPVAVHPSRRDPSEVRFPADSPNLSPGVSYLGSAARFPHTEGAFASQVVLPSMMLRALPAGLNLHLASLAEPASVAWHAVSRAGNLRGKRVLVIGAGPIGALIVAVARRAGASEIVAVDLHELPLNVAQRVGAPITRVLHATDSASIAAVDADVVFESSGNFRGLTSAIAGATRGGTVVMVGLPPSGDQPVPVALAITRELKLIGSFRFNDELDEVLLALADGSLNVAPILTHTFPLSEIQEALAVASDPSRSSKVLVDFQLAESDE